MTTPEISPARTGRPERAEDAALWDVAATVVDPEIPVLTIEDLGILRAVRTEADGTARITITPTYSGCPAMETISRDLQLAVRSAGYDNVTVDLTLSPAWTTEWMSEEGRRKLERFGIAPPSGSSPVRERGPVRLALSVRCPHCGSLRTSEMSRFGSTSCKALYRCSDCAEPFDYFKVH